MSDKAILMTLSDVNDLDEVCAELGIQESDATPAEAVRELKAEITALRARLAQAITDNERLRDRFSHYHVAKYVEGKLVDQCASCGFDLRDGIHKREAQ